MITKEQIEQEAISRYGKYAKSIQQDSVIKLIMNAFNYGAEWAIKQQPYSAEDMKAFGQMCLAYMPMADGYVRRNNIGGEAPKNISQIFQKWEEQKNG